MELKIYDKQGIVKMTVSPDNSSQWNHEVGVENVVTVNFTTWEFLVLEVGWYILVEGQRFSIKSEYRPKHIHDTKYTYNLKFYGREHDAQDILFCRLNQGEDDLESVFAYDGTPMDFLQKVVANMNRNTDGVVWKAGEAISANRQTINFNGLYCWDALGEIARAFGTEWWMDGEYLNISKCERGESVSLGYGQGLKSGLTQNENTNSVKWFTRLIPVGSSKNIDKNKYGYATLQLPGREKYIDINTQYGLKEYREEAAFSEIYPHRVGAISSVRSEERTNEETGNYTVYYVKDSSLPFNPDEYMIGGEVIHMTFNSGALAGKDFEVNWNNETKEFEIINQYPDENTQLPGRNLVPSADDTYVLWNIGMPDEYIRAAEQELKTAVDVYLAEYSKDISVYSGSTDYIYISKNDVPLLLGQRVRLLSEVYFGNIGRDSRITRVSRKLNNLNEATIDCSDAIASSWKSSVDSSLNQLQFAVSNEMAQALIQILKTGEPGTPSDYNVLSALRSLNTFLRKDKDDRSKGKISSDKGFEVGKDKGIFKDSITSIVTAVVDKLKNVYHIESPEFQMGELGNGYVLKYENGKSYFEVDEMLVRRIAYFIELIIKQLQYVGGEIALTPASMKCTRVEEYEEYYRCYFEKERDGQSIKQEFRAGDQARAQSFNIEEDANANASNQYYWRLVVRAESDENFIDLSKIDCDTGSLPPRVGDEIVQLGNRTDASRQNAIILSTIGDDAPSIKQYEGINSYSLVGKDVTVISPKGNKLKGDFLSKTGQDLIGRLDDLGASLDDVINQTDKVYTIWFYDYNPSSSNYPTNEWIDEAAKQEHVEDIFYNQEAGMAWRYQEVSEGVYAWVVITDHETIKALENAAKAQATADKKMQNFVTQPVPPYSVGDRWSNAVYGTQYDNDELVCINAKAAGEAFSINDWQLVSSMSSADKKHFYSEFERTDSSIQSLVADGKTKDEAIAAANAAAKAASDTASTASETANAAKNQATTNATAIVQTNQNLSLVAAAFETNADGSLKLDANGKPILTKAAGAVITADAAGLYAKQSDVTAEFNVRVKYDPSTGKVLSAIKMSADQIDISANDYISIINGGTTTIKSERLDLVGKVTFSMLDSNAQSTINGKATSGDIDSKITAYDKTLGSLAKLNAVEKAQLGTTIISGGYIKGELLNVTEIHATSGSIAGFKISDNNLTNEGFSSDAAVIFKNNNNIAAIGSNVIPIESGANGAAYFQCHTEDSSRVAKNYGMIVSAAGTGENVAIGIDGGCIEGFAMKNRIISGSGTIALARTDCNVIVTSSSACTLLLPEMKLCDDGHVVRIKRLGSGTITIQAPMCETFTSGTTGKNYPGIIYDNGSAVGSGNGMSNLPQYDSCEFVWVRDLRITLGGITYNGAWIQYKMPKSW